MFGLVPYNISPIQQGIQYGHAVVEYAQKYAQDVDYQEWATKWKTFIILNGGTTNLNTPGTLNVHEFFLESLEITHANFFEPDLGDQLTAVVFLVDERVFNKEKWPDWKPFDYITKEPNPISYEEWLQLFSDDDNEITKILKLREFLKNFRLA